METLTGSFERWAGDTLTLRSEKGELRRVRRTELVRLDESATVLEAVEEQNSPVTVIVRESFKRNHSAENPGEIPKVDICF